MPWITRHECRQPVTWRWGRIGRKLGTRHHPVGSIWKCPRCGRRWKLISYFAKNHHESAEWTAEPAAPPARQAPPGPAGQGHE